MVEPLHCSAAAAGEPGMYQDYMVQLSVLDHPRWIRGVLDQRFPPLDLWSPLQAVRGSAQGPMMLFALLAYLLGGFG